MRPKTEFLLTLFGGMFGIHKFAKKHFFVGLIYLCTGGLFMFGWIVDSVKAWKRYSESMSHERKMAEFEAEVNNKPDALHSVSAPGLNLVPEEHCVYFGLARHAVTKNRVAGYVHENGGARVQIMSGMSIGRSTGTTLAVRENVTEITSGRLYITNKRIVFSAPKGAFAKPLSSISTLGVTPESIEIQIGNSFYELLVPDSPRCINTLEGAIKGIPVLQ